MDAYRHGTEVPGLVTSERLSPSALMSGIAAEVNAEHAAALRHAGDAVEHARRAGEVLLRAKAELPHGNFLPWLSNNCAVSERQAQRYMSTAQGKRLPLRAIKNDTVSDLPLREPEFVPTPGCVMSCRVGERAFVIEQSVEPAHFFATAFALLGTDDASVECLTRPIRSDHIECALHQLGLPEPAAASWRIRRCTPVSVAMGVTP